MSKSFYTLQYARASICIRKKKKKRAAWIEEDRYPSKQPIPIVNHNSQGFALIAAMNVYPNRSRKDNDLGPFDGNTRIVAVVALTVAGVFVFLGLVLSLIRAMQQRAAERVCLVDD